MKAIFLAVVLLATGMESARAQDPVDQRREITSKRAGTPGARWGTSTFRVKYYPEQPGNAPYFEVTLDPNGSGSATVKLPRNSLNLDAIRSALMAQVTTTIPDTDSEVRKKLLDAIDEVGSAKAADATASVQAIPEFLESIERIAKKTDDAVENRKQIAKEEEDLKVKAVDVKAKGAKFIASNVYCCGDPAFAEKLEAYGQAGLDYCSGPIRMLTEVDINPAVVQQGRDEGNGLGCKDGTKFCFGKMKCGIFFDGSVLPFEGTGACAAVPTNAENGCRDPKIMTACARENLAIREGGENIRATITQGGRFQADPDQQKTLRAK